MANPQNGLKYVNDVVLVGGEIHSMRFHVSHSKMKDDTVAANGFFVLASHSVLLIAVMCRHDGFHGHVRRLGIAMLSILL